MLRGQHFGRRHQHGLMPSPHRGQHGGRGDHGFARPDITLQQPRHRLSAEHIVADLGQHTLLGDGQFEWQRSKKHVEKMAGHGDRRRVRTQSRRAFSRQDRKLNREQFLKRDPLPGGVEIRHFLGEVDHPQRVGLGGELVLEHNVRRQRLRQQRQIVAHRHVSQSSDRPIGQTLRARIDRRETTDMHRIVVWIVEPLPLGRDHLQLASAHIDPAGEADSHAWTQRARQVGLRPPPDAQTARAVAHDRLSRLPSLAQVLHADAGDLTDDGQLDAFQCVGDRADIAPVLVATWQMPEQVVDRVDPQRRHRLARLRRDASQHRYVARERVVVFKCRSRPTPSRFGTCGFTARFGGFLRSPRFLLRLTGRGALCRRSRFERCYDIGSPTASLLR